MAASKATPRLLFMAVFAGIIAFACGCHDAADVPTETTHINRLAESKGVEVRGLRLNLISNKSTVEAGDEITFTEELENRADRPIWHNFRGFYRHVREVAHWSGQVKSGAADPADRFVPNDEPRAIVLSSGEMPGFPASAGTSKHFASKLESGAKMVESYRFSVLRPGVYRFQSRWSGSYSADHKDELWKGEIDSNTVDVRVLPAPGRNHATGPE